MFFFFFRPEEWIDRALAEEVERRKAERRPTAVTAILKDAGLNPDTVYRIRRGEGPFSQATIDKVAEGLRVEPPKLESVLTVPGERSQLEVLREIEQLVKELKGLLVEGQGALGRSSPAAAEGATDLPEDVRQDLEAIRDQAAHALRVAEPPSPYGPPGRASQKPAPKRRRKGA